MKIARMIAPLMFGLALSFGATAATPVNINTADASTLAASLDGVGQAKAEAIIAYRQAHGPFENAAQLVKVKGIGQATVEANRSAIKVSNKK